MKLVKSIVKHRRDNPVKNAFTYNVFYVSFLLKKDIYTPKLFSFDQFNILSIYKKDHGACRESVDFYSWARKEFEKQGISFSDDMTIELITHPRLFGYAFNPISFFLLRDGMENLKAVLCEVNNTFGQNHNYILMHEDGSDISHEDTFHVQKNLYVSPFNSMDGYYTFNFLSKKNQFTSKIIYFKDDQKVLTTVMSGIYTELTNKSILKAIFSYPFMTFMVIFRIHWQAFKLYLKGVSSTLSDRPDYMKKKQTVGSKIKSNVKK